VNIGDSYQNAKGQAHGFDPKQPARRHGLRPQDVSVPGLKPKDLVGIPWLFAFEARRRGWYLRSDIIWAKPNPIPESVTDRPTKSHEYLFLLAKSSSYYYDAQAIAEPVSASMLQEMEQGYDGLGLKDYEAAGVQNPSSVKARIIANARRRRKGGSDKRGFGDDPFTRNKRTVWTINTQPYSGAHFATMPEKLVEPCIMAGSRPGDLVFDPFLGSGTVGAVAERLGRRWVGTDLSYQHLAKKRTAQRGLRFEEARA
jgi:site-specific DNA-methyltransferase (cytosine-N4-specific)